MENEILEENVIKARILNGEMFVPLGDLLDLMMGIGIINDFEILRYMNYNKHCEFNIKVNEPKCQKVYNFQLEEDKPILKKTIKK